MTITLNFQHLTSKLEEFVVDRDIRLKIIEEIEEKRKSALICYITGDRDNVSTRIAPDAIRVIFRHLELIGSKPRIDLLLYTRGGDVLTPWRLINLIREYTDEFNVIVPYRAYSAGTLICLGANEILMGKMGELGPIDPVVANAFNPKDPSNPSARVPISVEDVTAYLSLAKEKGELKEEESLVRVFSYLAEKVHPLSLGNVHRNYQLIRSIARKLLKLSSAERKESEVNAIVDALTKKLYAHNYMISRNEAKKDIGLKVTNTTESLDRMIWQLYKYYEEELKLREPFSPQTQGHQSHNLEFRVNGGIIESLFGLDFFVYNGVVEQVNNNNFNINIMNQQWEKTI